MKPTMTVVPVNIKTSILQSSIPDHDGPISYAPGIDDDKYLMA